MAKASLTFFPGSWPASEMPEDVRYWRRQSALVGRDERWQPWLESIGPLRIGVVLSGVDTDCVGIRRSGNQVRVTALSSTLGQLIDGEDACREEALRPIEAELADRALRELSWVLGVDEPPSFMEAGR